MTDFAGSDGLYVSARWRITGGTGEHLDDFFWLAQRLSGSTDSLLNVLLKESQYSDGWRITPLLAAGEAEIVRRRRQATDSSDPDEVDLLSGIQEEFHRRVGEQAKVVSERPRITTTGQRETAAPTDDGRLWAVLREEFCEFPTPGYRPYSVISSTPAKHAASPNETAPSKPPPMPPGMDQGEYLQFVKAWSTATLFRPDEPYTIAEFMIEQLEKRQGVLERRIGSAREQQAASRGTASIPTLPVLALEAHRRDQKRREKARRDLHEALEGYFATLSRYADIEITKLAEIVGAYACEIYNSSAEGYLTIPSIDPEALFGMAGPLNIGPTLADVEKCLSGLRVRRPWKISSDPVVRRFDDGRELMELHYEPWLRQEIANIVTRRFQDTRKQYEQSAPPEPAPVPEEPSAVRTGSDASKAAARQSFMAPHLAPVPRKPTRNAFAMDAQIVQSSFSRWYNGKQRLGKENLGKLAGLLSVDATKIPN